MNTLIMNPLLRLGGLPSRLNARLAARPAAGNFVWLAMDKGVRFLIAVVIGSWSARYLGKANFGLLNFAMPIVAVFASIAPLGMEALVVRQLIQEPDKAGRWLGTVMGFRTGAATLFALSALGVAWLQRPGDAASLGITAILAAGMALQALEGGELYFQARIEMRRLIFPRLGLSVFINLVKVGFILQGMSVYWFAGLTALEQAASGLLTLWLMRRALGSGQRLQFEFQRGWTLLKECWPLAISALTVILYMKTSQLVMNSRLSNADLGIFGAAIRIPDAFGFLPAILASSLLPGLLRSRAQGDVVYFNQLQRFFRINALVGYFVCLPLSLGSFLVVRLLFGPAYSDSGAVMAIYTWGLFFSFQGVARGQHLLNLRLVRLSLLFSVVGLFVSLGLNFLLIPRWGTMGAAAATAVANLSCSILTSFLVAPTRRIGRMQLMALATPFQGLMKDLRG
jgi:polysaccharide transporter, PST family